MFAKSPVPGGGFDLGQERGEDVERVMRRGCLSVTALNCKLCFVPGC